MLIALLVISVLNVVVIPKGTGAFGEWKIGFANYSTQHQYSCLLVVIENYSTCQNSSNYVFSFFPKGRVTFGEVQIWFVLIILFLRLALSI